MNEFIDEYKSRGKNVMDKVENVLFPGEMEIEGSGYERNILDWQIEKYLDQHFHEYIEEFNLIRELDLQVYDNKYEEIVDGIEEIKGFHKDVDAELSEIERRLDRIEKRVKK